MKLLDDPKIPTTRWNPRRPHHSHKPLDVTAEMGLKPGKPYCTRRRHHHLSAASTNLDLKTKNEALKIGGGILPPTRAEILVAWSLVRCQSLMICRAFFAALSTYYKIKGYYMFCWEVSYSFTLI
jgi:hypothetical protein